LRPAFRNLGTLFKW